MPSYTYLYMLTYYTHVILHTPEKEQPMSTYDYAAYGIDFEDALDRFGGNAALYKRLAAKYANDEHFVGMEAAMAAGDYEQAYRDAHALKGVAGNLSFKHLYDLATQACHALREGSPETAETLMGDLADAHKKALAGAIAFQEGRL